MFGYLSCRPDPACDCAPAIAPPVIAAPALPSRTIAPPSAPAPMVAAKDDWLWWLVIALVLLLLYLRR